MWRTLVVEISAEEDHERTQILFSVMEGCGGIVGYILTGTDWGDAVTDTFGSAMDFNYVIVMIVLVVTFTVFVVLSKEDRRSEVLAVKLLADINNPLHAGFRDEYVDVLKSENLRLSEVQLATSVLDIPLSYHDENVLAVAVPVEKVYFDYAVKLLSDNPGLVVEHAPTLAEYMKTIVFMPNCLRLLCAWSFFVWLSLEIYLFYFTDYVAEVVYGLDPLDGDAYGTAVARGRYVLMACSATCLVVSLAFEKVHQFIKLKYMFVAILGTAAAGNLILVYAPYIEVCVLVAFIQGFLLQTAWSGAFIIVSTYHSSGMFEDLSTSGATRGLATDIGAVFMMLFFSQIVQSICIGYIVTWAGSTAAVYVVSSISLAIATVISLGIDYRDL